jgi:hypothetical protein
MAQERTGDPYTESGAHAAVRQRGHLRQQARIASLRDADDLERHARAVIARGRRGVWLAACVFSLVALGDAALAWLALECLRDGPESMQLGNWAMLGFVVGLGALHFLWGWLVSQYRLGGVGRRLIRRAEYQRAMAALHMKEADDERLR